MGIQCYSDHKRKEIKSRKNIEPSKEIGLSIENIFEEYKCKIKMGDTEDFGFFCNLNLDQNITIITRKDSFDENFNFDTNYYIKTNNNNNWSLINFEKIYISDNHNIILLQISKSNNIIHNISFLEIAQNDFMKNMNHYSDNSQYYLFYLENEKIKYLYCSINEQNDYTFDYLCNKNKEEIKYALLLNSNKNELVGIYMKTKNNKGILIKGIIKGIQNINKIDNNFNKIYNIDKNLEKLSQDLNRLYQNNNTNLNNNESSITYIDNDISEEKTNLNNIKSFQKDNNDFDDLGKKSLFKYINNNNKLNNNNTDSSSIKQSNINKNNMVHFDKSKNDISGKNMDTIKNFNNQESNLNKSKNNDINKQIFEEQEKKSNLKDIENRIDDSKIYEENNDLNKKIESKNIQNGYGKNDYCNEKLNNSDNKGEISKEISLYFIFNNGKELYLDVIDSCTFEQVIEQLNEKYLWLNNIKIKEYKINDETILRNKKIKENKLVNNSIINIIEYS